MEVGNSEQKAGEGLCDSRLPREPLPEVPNHLMPQHGLLSTIVLAYMQPTGIIRLDMPSSNTTF